MKMISRCRRNLKQLEVLRDHLKEQEEAKAGVVPRETFQLFSELMRGVDLHFPDLIASVTEESFLAERTPAGNQYNLTNIITSLDMAIAALKDAEADPERLVHILKHEPLADLIFVAPFDVDAVTGLRVRGAFDRHISRYLEVARQQDVPVALLMVDVDDFKQCNETYGHPAGDSALRAIAGCLTKSVRAKGGCYRYGGDEFAALLANHDREDAFGVAERMRKSVAALRVTDISRALSVTIGVAVGHGGELSAGQWLRNADSALSRAKRAGKNRTYMYLGDPSQEPADT